MRIADYNGAEIGLDSLLLLGVAEGTWPKERERLATGLSAEQAGLMVPAEDLEAAIDAFRRERGLAGADDLAAWLAARGLSASDLADHLTRTLTAGADSGPSAGEGELRARARIAVLLDGFAAAAADRLLLGAAAADILEHPTPDPSDAETETLIRQAVEDDALPLEGRDPARLGPLAAHVLRLRAALAAVYEALDPAAVDKTLAERRLDWTTVEYDELVLATEEAAREAVLCVREDSLDLATVGALAGVPARTLTRRIEESDRTLGGQLLTCEPGLPLGPLQDRLGWSVIVLRERRLPEAADGTTWERARELTVRKRLERRLAGRVRWYVAL